MLSTRIEKQGGHHLPLLFPDSVNDADGRDEPVSIEDGVQEDVPEV